MSINVDRTGSMVLTSEGPELERGNLEVETPLEEPA